MIMTYLTSKRQPSRVIKPSDPIRLKGQVLEGEKTLAEALAQSSLPADTYDSVDALATEREIENRHGCTLPEEPTERPQAEINRFRFANSRAGHRFVWPARTTSEGPRESRTA